MSFILVPKRGHELQVNAWNWRSTLELLVKEHLLDPERHELLGTHGCGTGVVDGELARRIGIGVERWLRSSGMKPGERMLADLTVTSETKIPVVFSSSSEEKVDDNDLYSATYEWLVAFKEFCRQSDGFDVF